MNTQDIFTKAEQHEVNKLNATAYRVKSATSARAYMVDLSAEAPACNCRWQTFNPHSECSHIKAVYLVIAGIKELTPRKPKQFDLKAANELLFGF